MEPLRTKTTETESLIQGRLIRNLTIDGWYCRRTHGNMYQAGFPDVYACHKRYGTRWVEVKRPTGGRFTQAQIDVFHKFATKNVGVWVLTDDCDQERRKLFGPSNWYTHLPKRGIVLNADVPRIAKSGPEGVIQDGIIDALTSTCACGPACAVHHLQNWFCLETYGSVYQSGFPDIYACHRVFGARWVECKNPRGYKFTPAQYDVFPRLSAEGVAIHVLIDYNSHELNKVFGPSNWYSYAMR